MVRAENEDLPQDEMSSSKEIALINKRSSLVLMAPESVPKMKTSRPNLAEVLEDGLTVRMTTPEIQLGRTSIAEI